MRVIVVGGTGTVGQAVVDQLKPRHDVVIVGMSSGEYQVDIRDIHSIEKMYQAIGPFDALVSTVGKVKFAPLAEMTAESYAIGLQDKLMGQVNLVLAGLKHINPKGSFTLTSGILSDDPIVLGSSAAMVNAGLNSFVKSAAIEMPQGIRINAVSPTVLEESLESYGPFFLGFEPAKASRVALAYSKSVEGAQTGQVYNVW